MSKVISKLKQIQADSLVFFVKTHNYHWNVKGLDFHAVHSATEAIYDDFAEIFDDVAERILQLGEKPLVTIADILKNAKVEEEKQTDFNSQSVLKAVLKEFEYFLKNFKELSELADEKGDKGTASYADEKVAKLEKSIWMLKAQLS